ncbi:hypothetical protein QR680_009655 [Steinernema hermaphroditum]|uniref:F-box domain-containing protein n=1 Tax=Steinernema hermaphroditum TaxID=289476 RepID=A0AA39IL59_9BILA|nr:hypothetical protein QR680_009655 [Steinernema hermaphroditum]
MLNPLVATADPNLPQLLPDLLQYLSESFRVVECEFVVCPNLHKGPFRSPDSTAAFLCSDLSLLVPSTSSVDFGKEIVCQLEEGTVVTKASSPAEIIRIHLEGGDDWKSPIRDLLNSCAGPDPQWLLLCVEARTDSDFALFHLLNPQSKPCEAPVSNSTILIAPMKPEPSESAPPALSSVKKMASMFTGAGKASEDPLKKTPKVVRRVAKPPSPPTSTVREETDAKTGKKALISTKTVKAANGAKIVRKKIVDRSTPKENTPELVQEVREEISNVSYVVRLGASPAPDGEFNTEPLPQSPTDKENKKETEVLEKIGDIDGVGKDEIRSVSGEKKETNGNAVESTGIVESAPKAEERRESATWIQEPPLEPKESNGVQTRSSQPNGEEEGEHKPNETGTATPWSAESATPAFKHLEEQQNGPNPVDSSTAPETSAAENGVSRYLGNGTNGVHPGRKLSYDDNSSTSTIVDASKNLERPSPTESSASITSASIAARLTAIRNRESSAESGDGARTSRSSGLGTVNGVKSQLSNDIESDLSLNEDSHSSGFSEVLRQHKISPAIDHSHFMARTGQQMPIIVLQKVLKYMSYEELGRLRQVTPLWDEMCGQILNGSYYDLTAQADRLLTECQRRVHKENHLAGPIQVLTNLQVHVINPVDIMRVAMDEGVCCFPYGKILDKAFEVLERVKEAIRLQDDLDIPIRWEHVAELSRRAQVHYKVFVEGVVEDRMGEVLNLKAQQRIQRIDSFMIESTVSKLERVATQAKDDLHWEMEQLKVQNAQLRKDNRDIKRDYMKLESRVEVLERKFKTVARLLQ